MITLGARMKPIFITVTDAKRTRSNRPFIFDINASLIVSIEPYSYTENLGKLGAPKNGSLITLVGGVEHLVTEPPAKIKSKIQEQG